MGVHQNRETYLKIKELLGIPADEPIFILRAQDQFSTRTLRYYKEVIYNRTIIGNLSEKWIAEIGSITNDFLNWQRKNRYKVKEPD